MRKHLGSVVLSVVCFLAALPAATQELQVSAAAPPAPLDAVFLAAIATDCASLCTCSSSPTASCTDEDGQPSNCRDAGFRYSGSPACGPPPIPSCTSACTCSATCALACKNATGQTIQCGQFGKCNGMGSCAWPTCGDGICGAALGETGCSCPADCGNPADKDLDAIPDALEQALAQRFFPNLWMVWPYSDRQQFYGTAQKLPFTVSVLPGGYGYCGEAFECLEIRYGLAYNWDCGDNPGNGCDGSNNHQGDSEYYALYVSRKDQGLPLDWSSTWATAQTSASSWRLMADFTSAHFGTATESSGFMIYKGTNAGGNGYNGPAGGTGTSSNYGIFASEGKHANYHSVAECDRGGFYGSDACQPAYNVRTAAVTRLQNIGSPSCYASFVTTIPFPNPNPTLPPTASPSYGVWSGLQFAESTPYAELFTMSMEWLRVQWCVYHTGCFDDDIWYSPTERGLVTYRDLMELCNC